MPVQIEYARLDGAARDTVEQALRSMGKNDLADKVPVANLRLAADIVSLLAEAATAFDDGRPLDGLTSAERALEPKWGGVAESAFEYEYRDASDEQKMMALAAQMSVPA